MPSDRIGYYGWELADTLTKRTYPLFKEYVKAEKPLDDELFEQLNNDITRISDNSKSADQSKQQQGLLKRQQGERS